MSADPTTNLQNISDKEYKRRTRSWMMYDWANSAFATTILAAVLPIYYSQVAGSSLSSAAQATQYWSITLSISVLIIAIFSPVLGTASDVMSGKKKFLSIFVGIGVIGTALLYFVDQGDWLMASIFFIIGRIGFGASVVFYDSLLPHIAKEEDQDKISAQGYAVGYLGGGVLLVINFLMITFLPGTLGVRLSFLSVAVWWLLFSIPIFRNVPEPHSTASLPAGANMWRESFSRIATTIREIRQYKDLFTYLVAFLIYNDGIGIVISVAAIYGAELGFGSTELILALVLVQFLGLPYSLIFGNLPTKTEGKRQSRYLAFVVFNIIALPIVAIVGQYVLPQTMTGRPSPDFVAQGEFVGQGTHELFETAQTTGAWSNTAVSAAALGNSCAWYATDCDEAELGATYVETEDTGAELNFLYNGQNIELLYSTGPNHGRYAVEIDGIAQVDDAGDPLIIDGYNPTVRYDVTTELTTESEGQHTVTLINLAEANPESGGTLISVQKATVLQPERTSSLGAIIGILFGLQVVAGLFAYLLGPALFTTWADWLDTKRSIMLALVAYTIVAIWGFFLSSVIEFWFLAWMIAIVQGGSQALSRSLYAALTPTTRSGEYFGFFSIMSKFASFLSPFLFVIAVALFDSSRPAVLALTLFFATGMWLLSKVDVARGVATAKEVDAQN